MKQIAIESAPAAIGPYSQAIAANGLLFISGQLPLAPATERFAASDAPGQMRQCLANVSTIATAAGAGLADLVKTSAIEVSARPKGASVEVEAIVALRKEA